MCRVAPESLSRESTKFGGEEPVSPRTRPSCLGNLRHYVYHLYNITSNYCHTTDTGVRSSRVEFGQSMLEYLLLGRVLTYVAELPIQEVARGPSSSLGGRTNLEGRIILGFSFWL